MRKAFLFTVTLAATGRVTLACTAAGMSRKSAYALKARDPAFAAAWEDAKRAASARPKVQQARRLADDGPKVTERTRATQSVWSASQRLAEDILIADLLRRRPWKTDPTRNAAPVGRPLSDRGRASA